MYLKTAGAASLVGFGLSFVAALLGGVPFLEVLFRAVIGGIVLGGLAVAGEFLLRSQLPDLFSPVAESAPEPEEAREGGSVNIVLDDDVVERPFVEEIVEQTGFGPSEPAPERQVSSPAPAVVEAPAAEPSSGDEPLEEIGSFLNSFRPASPEGEDAEGSHDSVAPPDIGDYVPRESSGSSSSSSAGAYAPPKGADLEGMEQDPTVLAKAIKTVMNKT